MKRTLLHRFAMTTALLATLVSISSCKQNSEERRKESIVTAVAGDFDSLNPLLIQFAMSREVCKLLYPSLVKPTYDEKKGTIIFLPNAAKSWAFADDGKKVTFRLRNNALW
ncbi:MAG: ABC transporter substrate-binding protein, partial [Chlorobium sp.]